MFLSLLLSVGPVLQTRRPRAVRHKPNYIYMQHVVSLAWEKGKHMRKPTL